MASLRLSATTILRKKPSTSFFTAPSQSTSARRFAPIWWRNSPAFTIGPATSCGKNDLKNHTLAWNQPRPPAAVGAASPTIPAAPAHQASITRLMPWNV